MKVQMVDKYLKRSLWYNEKITREAIEAVG